MNLEVKWSPFLVSKNTFSRHHSFCIKNIEKGEFFGRFFFGFLRLLGVNASLTFDGWQQRRRQYVTFILGSQKSGESQSVSHWWLRLQTALPGHCHGLAGLYLHRDDAAVHRVADHVRPHKRDTQRCPQHLLLDSSYLHTFIRTLETGRGRRPSSRCRQNQKRRRQKTREILSVGRLLPVLSGKQVSVCSYTMHL